MTLGRRSVASFILSVIIALSLSITAFAASNFSSGGSSLNQLLTSPLISSLTVACQGGYVATPRGCVPQECAFNSVKDVNRLTGELFLRNNTRITVSLHCLIGSPRSPQSISTTQISANSPISPTTGIAPFPDNNWVEWTEHDTCGWFGCGVLGSFTGNWIVPAAPVHNSGQTIFLFIDFQDDIFNPTQIIQPVLQWGSACNGGGAYWSVADWFVWGQTCATAQWSGDMPVNVGDHITGTIQDCYGIYPPVKFCINITDTTTGAGVGLSVTGFHDMYRSDVSLEVFRVQQCGDYPAGQDTFSNLVISPAGGGGWNPNISYHDCGQGINIQNGNPSSVTLIF